MRNWKDKRLKIGLPKVTRVKLNTKEPKLDTDWLKLRNSKDKGLK